MSATPKTPDLTGESHARDLDATDPLASLRDRFHIPEGTVYLDGNSLGPLSRDAERAVLAALESWQVRGIAGWLATTCPPKRVMKGATAQ